ncbi:Glucose-6-phosphate isomerase [Candidatus Filomicrobium marinum]|uniref:Glucose-6-phosphate isomerase n=1 Tax=Candidatus Filomicrobium marinum TaxID=1608628 RepID=A0A0D6JAV8_9HYPH|nr:MULTISPECIES: glucose-6-phosphate isomerase [Filomicrobium]MCV0368765.1 glucose-6-phosphate isomerase [Filomicrobium sp.]CFW98874.1 Glucose-6-phosphate isomerase [Candidatus Filomicrobium marinum]CPR14968.1 Glucose-6-phosphate isomerase [Candidatus Filomicrobium marinum]
MTNPVSLSKNSASAEGCAPFRISIDGCMETVIGRHGLSEHLLSRYLKRAEPELAKLRDHYKTGRLPLLNIPEETADLDEAHAALARLSEGARLIVFFGTGGSGLGGQTLAQLAGWNIPGGAAPDQRKRPRTRFYDNLDGATLSGALDILDLETTRFVVTSKSGSTTETLAQAIAALSAVKAAGLEARIPELFLGITEEDKPGKSNGLRSLFAAHGIPMLAHHDGIGGRYSCLTNVGLMPAMARGLDAFAVRQGAADVVQKMLDARRPADFAPAVSAAAAVALNKEKGVRLSVIMPYADRLGRLADWYVQLWAESLGKNGQGTCPIAAVGPLDQHSQLQFFMDGPPELWVTVVRVATVGNGPVVDAEMARQAGADYMAGRHVGDIVAAQAAALPEALAQAGRPVRTIDVDRLDERAIGGILMHFMLETILAGRIMGIDPFDQPAVELAKILTRKRLDAGI